MHKRYYKQNPISVFSLRFAWEIFCTKLMWSKVQQTDLNRQSHLRWTKVGKTEDNDSSQCKTIAFKKLLSCWGILLCWRSLPQNRDIFFLLLLKNTSLLTLSGVLHWKLKAHVIYGQSILQLKRWYCMILRDGRQ